MIKIQFIILSALKGRNKLKAYHIYLLRHGTTEGNKQGRYIGRLDMPLSREGEEELIGLAGNYPYPPAQVYFTSPLQRCRRSLEILYPGVEQTVVDGLAECDFGDFEGKTLEELQPLESYEKWVTGMKNGDTSAAPPNGESSIDFQKRICRTFGNIVERLMRSGTTSAVIMAHGGVITTILGTLAVPRRPFYDWIAGSGKGYETAITPQLWMSGRIVEVAGTLPRAKD